MRKVDTSKIDERVAAMTVAERFERSVELSKLLPTKAQQDREADRVLAVIVTVIAVLMIIGVIWGQ